MDPRSDQELVEAANRGEAAAFEALYLRHRDWVVRLARRVTGNREDALDVLQDTFAYWLRKFPGFRLTASVTTFLYPVVKNLSLGLRRKAGRLAPAGDGVLENLPSRPEEAAGTRADLAAVLAALPEAQRETLLMRFVDGMALDGIAAALHIPLGTVKSRLHNALKTLREDARTKTYFQG